ncbi:propionyl-CoA synthetase [Candidatus Nanopelagicales bacterium]|nr:propionyl-CoA synthetase [Candidatus Nanopelagicales bacterium]
MSYQASYEASLQHPDEFWLAAAQGIDWIKQPRVARDSRAAPLYRWFPEATLNTAYNALDRHVIAGRADQTAIIYDSPVTGSQEKWTYSFLLEAVARFAGGLRNLGVDKGDRVVIYMPMIPQTVVAMLACARIGAIHSVVFGGFAPAELSSRIDDAKPKVIVTASCGIEPSRTVEYKPLVDAAIEMSEHSVERVVVFQRPQVTADMGPRDVEWDHVLASAPPVEPVEVSATDPLYILYTSGTTGKPKGIVRDNGGHAVAMAWSFANVYGMGPGDVWWSASDVGWVVGHSYIVYAPLISGATTVLYEGKPVGTPDAGAFWRVIEQYGVQAVFTAPTAIRAIKKEDPEGVLLRDYNTDSLHSFFFAGERLDPDTYEWAGGHLGVPIIDNWWQTETGWPIAANLRGLEPMPIKPGSPSVPVPGYDIQILDHDHQPVPAGSEGDIAIKLPLPPGTLPTLWGDDNRYIASYLSDHPGYYTSGDGGFIDEDGYVYVMGRTDDVINVAGHRLSTGSMEAVVASHPDVAECAVIGVHDDLKGQIPRAFVVLKAGSVIDADDLQRQVVSMVREEIGPVAAFKEAVVVPALPKTRSGKILRRTMRGIAAGRDEPIPSTIEDPAVLDALRDILQG